ncbi:MAG: patatin [Thalassobius sp.]|nr:patatin [Thalassovita sp.]
MSDSKKKVRILSIDGGGIRGVIPAVVLEYVEKKIAEITENPNARIADYFDLIAGTSTGGILTCIYLTPNPDKNEDAPNAKYSATRALNFYVENGYKIFNESKRNDWFGLRQLFNANQYKPDFIEKLLDDEFKELKLSQLLKPCIITTYNMVTKSAFFFSSTERPESKRDFYVKDVARSTSAAPTYFPPAVIKNLITDKKMVNLDGGVFANNPAMCAYAESSSSYYQAKTSTDDMLILSIGTGGGQFDLPDIMSSDHWGVLNWAKSIPEIMMDGSFDTVDYQMKQLFRKEEGNTCNYKRVDFYGEKRYAKNMADASKSNIKLLKEAGKMAIKQANEKKSGDHTLDSFIELLVQEESKESIV